MEKDPAHFIVNLLGGPKAVGVLVGKHWSTVARWKLSKAKRGAEGRIPLSNLFSIWSELIKRGSPVSLEQLVFTEDEQQALSELRSEVSQSAPDASLNKNGKIIP